MLWLFFVEILKPKPLKHNKLREIFFIKGWCSAISVKEILDGICLKAWTQNSTLWLLMPVKMQGNDYEQQVSPPVKVTHFYSLNPLNSQNPSRVQIYIPLSLVSTHISYWFHCTYWLTLFRLVTISLDLMG